jgi:hypothetical protein
MHAGRPPLPPVLANAWFQIRERKAFLETAIPQLLHPRLFSFERAFAGCRHVLCGRVYCAFAFLYIVRFFKKNIYIYFESVTFRIWQKKKRGTIRYWILVTVVPNNPVPYCLF